MSDNKKLLLHVRNVQVNPSESVYRCELWGNSHSEDPKQIAYVRSNGEQGYHTWMLTNIDLYLELCKGAEYAQQRVIDHTLILDWLLHSYEVSVSKEAGAVISSPHPLANRFNIVDVIVDQLVLLSTLDFKNNIYYAEMGKPKITWAYVLREVSRPKQDLRAHILEKFPSATILNDLSPPYLPLPNY